MYVNRLRLRGLKPLRCDIPEDGAGFPEPARRRLLLHGANGSGKSTFLEAIVTLWDFFGEWIDAGPGRTISRRSRCFKHDLAEVDLAAMELRGLVPDDRPLWLGMGKVKDWVELKDQHPEAEFAGLVQSKKTWEVQLPPGDWTTFRQHSLVGSEPRPNVGYFPPEDRTVAMRTGKPPHLVDLMPYRWLATCHTNVDLESLLLTVQAQSREEYDAAVRLINQSLDNQRKEIVGFGPHGLVIRGKTEFGAEYEHPIGKLSSGEKQMLLLIGFVAATMRPGGIVIMDEPDLHIHMVMVQQLLGSIEAIVNERDGQLIVAAHSQEVWDWFSLTSERIELTPWRRVHV
jgi:energy-coupling factor transporter ATP-binding protein EcfA2